MIASALSIVPVVSSAAMNTLQGPSKRPITFKKITADTDNKKNARKKNEQKKADEQIRIQKELDARMEELKRKFDPVDDSRLIAESPVSQKRIRKTDVIQAPVINKPKLVRTPVKKPMVTNNSHNTGTPVVERKIDHLPIGHAIQLTKAVQENDGDQIKSLLKNRPGLKYFVAGKILNKVSASTTPVSPFKNQEQWNGFDMGGVPVITKEQLRLAAIKMTSNNNVKKHLAQLTDGDKK